MNSARVYKHLDGIWPQTTAVKLKASGTLIEIGFAPSDGRFLINKEHIKIKLFLNVFTPITHIYKIALRES